MKYRNSGIGHAEAVLRQCQEKYLTANGWVHTSDTPGSLWLWRKPFDAPGGMTMNFAVDTKSAIRIQIGMEG